jgi:hypothetical protein
LGKNFEKYEVFEEIFHVKNLNLESSYPQSLVFLDKYKVANNNFTFFQNKSPLLSTYIFCEQKNIFMGPNTFFVFAM